MDEVGVKVSPGEEVGGEVFIGSWVWLSVVWEFEINPEIWEPEEILGKNEVPGIVDDQTLGRTGDRLIGAGIFIDNVEEDEGNEVLEEMAPVKQKVYLNIDRKLQWKLL